MHRILCASLVGVFIWGYGGAGHAQETEAPGTVAVKEVSEPVENFRLTDHTGRSVELYRLTEAPAVVLYIHGVGCPIVRQSLPGLNRLREEFEPRGVKFLMINANPQDSREDLVKEAEEFEIEIPILQDRTQVVTTGLGCKRTAEAIVIEPANAWRIAYRGAIDDRFNYGAQRDQASKEWLREALTAVLAGEPVVERTTTTKGCLINLTSPSDVDYASSIAPILEEKCVTCHRPGGTGPFAMSSHKKVSGWAPMMQEVIRTRRMPPWHVDSEYGHFDNDRALSPEEEQTLVSWLAAGAPRGEGEDPLAKPTEAAPEEWALGEPDLLAQLPEPEHLAAEGSFDYRYVYVPTHLTEDKWVRGLEVRPTNTAVVHHALIFVVYPPEYSHIQPEEHGGLNGYFAAYLPGMRIKPLPEDTGQFFPAGSTLVFQMHYNATGKEETDQTKLALYFHDAPPHNAMVIRAAAETEFRIPPKAEDYPTRADFRFGQDAMLYGLSPHMHYRGSRFRFTAQYPNGANEILLNVPFYEFDWQPMYMLAEPKPIAKGSRIVCDGAFDNSAFNPRNPDPSRAVEFGEQSWEEMFIGYVAYAYPIGEGEFSKMEIPEGEPITAENLVGTEWRIGRRFSLMLGEDGKVFARGNAIGAWSVDGGVVVVKGLDREIQLLIYGSQLLFNGRPLERVLAESAPAATANPA